MLLRIYLIIEEGADRVFAQTTHPAWYKRPTDRKSAVLAVDVPLVGVDRVDGVVTMEPRDATEPVTQRLPSSALERMKASPEEAVGFIEWLADQPCKTNAAGTPSVGAPCRIRAKSDPQWCCPACRAHLLRYGE